MADLSHNSVKAYEPDVLVCGLGSAGVAAAISAARHGARVLAVERWGFAGGYMTAIYGPGMDGFVDVRTGLPVVGGLAIEFAGRAAGKTGDIRTTRFHPGSDLRDLAEYPEFEPLWLDVERFKLEADRLLKAAGAKLLYHTHVASAEREGNRVGSVLIVNKAGITRVSPKVVVDATGDADVVAFAGGEYSKDPEIQPMSLHFRIRNVRDIRAELRDKCAEALHKARDAGEIELFGGPWMGKLREGELWINATRIPGDGTVPEDVTQAEVVGRENAHTMFRIWKDRVPEFSDAEFVESGPVAGVRESRRIKGRATITKADIIERRESTDAVVYGAWYLDRHPRRHSGFHMHEVVRPYPIGFGTMLPESLDNVIVAGRCHSADSAALASTRVNITAMGMGQAAGVAAALSVEKNCSPADLVYRELQRTLIKDGAILGKAVEDVLAVGDKNVEDWPESKSR
jgi:hypothetical protein